MGRVGDSLDNAVAERFSATLNASSAAAGPASSRHGWRCAPGSRSTTTAAALRHRLPQPHRLREDHRTPAAGRRMKPGVHPWGNPNVRADQRPAASFFGALMVRHELQVGGTAGRRRRDASARARPATPAPARWACTRAPSRPAPGWPAGRLGHRAPGLPRQDHRSSRLAMASLLIGVEKNSQASIDHRLNERWTLGCREAVALRLTAGRESCRGAQGLRCCAAPWLKSFAE
jgi:hypothetical protein